MATKPTKTQVRKKLDDTWSLLVKQRAKKKCEVCGRVQGLNSHHIVGRKNLSVRWDLRNGASLCIKCHKFGTQSAHEDPLWFREWLEENRWEDYAYLYTVKNQIKKWTLDEMIEHLDNLKSQLDD